MSLNNGSSKLQHRVQAITQCNKQRSFPESFFCFVFATSDGGRRLGWGFTANPKNLRLRLGCCCWGTKPSCDYFYTLPNGRARGTLEQKAGLGGHSSKPWCDLWGRNWYVSYTVSMGDLISLRREISYMFYSAPLTWHVPWDIELPLSRSHACIISWARMDPVSNLYEKRTPVMHKTFQTRSTLAELRQRPPVTQHSY